MCTPRGETDDVGVQGATWEEVQSMPSHRGHAFDFTQTTIKLPVCPCAELTTYVNYTKTHRLFLNFEYDDEVTYQHSLAISRH